jgi:predicted nucleic acid-binding protein
LSGPFVLDASVTLSWAFAYEATPFTARVLERLKTAHAVAPALWPFEVINAVAGRRGRISAAQQAEFLERLRLLPVSIEHRPATWLGQQILPLARAHQLTAYDAAYLELAIREGLPLATIDGNLRKAAAAEGAALAEFEPCAPTPRCCSRLQTNRRFLPPTAARMRSPRSSGRSSTPSLARSRGSCTRGR